MHGCVCLVPGKRRGRRNESSYDITLHHEDQKSHMKPDDSDEQLQENRRTCTHCRGFYLFHSSGQVLDKKPPEVVERLQLSGLCDGKETVTTTQTVRRH